VRLRAERSEGAKPPGTDALKALVAAANSAARLVPQRTVRTAMIVLHPIPRPIGPRLGQIGKLLPRQKLVPQPAVERLGVAVLPRAARLDIQRLHLGIGQPAANRRSDELRPVVAADVFRHPASHGQLRQYVDHILRCHPTSHLQSQAFPGVLVHHRQPLQRPTVAGPVVDEIPRPHMVLVLRSTPSATVGTVPQMPLFSLLLRHFQPLLTPQPMNQLAVHTPAFPPQQLPNPPISIPGMFPHQLQHPAYQPLLELSQPWAITLRRSWLPQGPARPTFGNPQLPLCFPNRLPTAYRTGQFPPNASRRMALSSSASASSRFSRWFSNSNRFSRLDCSAFIPPDQR